MRAHLAALVIALALAPLAFGSVADDPGGNCVWVNPYTGHVEMYC